MNLNPLRRASRMLPSALRAGAGSLVLLLALGSDSSGQDTYRIGPGDRLQIRVVGRAEGGRATVPVAPDGTVSFLQASGIRVAGMTIPEARATLETALREYEKNIRVVVSPASIGSKTYTMLGQVGRSGSFPLDRRVTLLEAIAASGGLAKADPQAATQGTRADLGRSFVVRRGRRLGVDFTRLYFEGDMSQNVVIEPGDYVYIASNLDSEFYVFGSVARQGLQRLTPDLSVTGAITRQGGFSEDAWPKRVLLVRGSAAQPQAFIVEVDAILKGQKPDVPVEAGDILYVHSKPWQDAQNIVGNAFTSFVQALALGAIDEEFETSR